MIAKIWKTRMFAGLIFEPIEAGHWVSACGNYHLFDTTRKYTPERWQLFKAIDGNEKAERLGVGPNMKLATKVLK